MPLLPAKLEGHPFQGLWEFLQYLQGNVPAGSQNLCLANSSIMGNLKNSGRKFGISNVYNSMGYENFVYALYDKPDFVTQAFEIMSNWCQKVIERVNEMDFDFVWISEDIAFQQGIRVTLDHYDKYIFPFMKKVADKIRHPKVYHSDGNYMAVLDRVIQYNPSGIANLEPPVMDIFKLKKTYGQKVCLGGNIDLHYTLTRGTPEETSAEVREKMERVGGGGG